MILSCNSCGKKFVVPDQAITSTGRMVQCGACGNKWKQFPNQNQIKRTVVRKREEIKKTKPISKNTNLKKKKSNKKREINLYSPEYLRKKHGINLNNIEATITQQNKGNKVSIGFYNSLIILIVLGIFISRGLYFIQDFIIDYFPFTEFYLNYFFENVRNMFEIWKDLISYN